MRVLRALIASAILLIGCGAAATPSLSPNPTPGPVASAHYPLTLTDDRHAGLTLTQAPVRIVSLAPSATEIVFALGGADRLVAVDDFSDYPAAAAAIPHIGGFRTPPETVISYHPDLILAITSGSLSDQLTALHQPIFVLDPDDIEGVYHDILALGTLLDRETAAQRVVAGMRERIEAVAARAKAASTRPRVMHEVDSTNPQQIFVAGPHNFIDSMIATAGGMNIAADAPLKWPRFSPEQIIARDPQIIVLADTKYGASPGVVRARPGWGVIAAVRDGALYPIDQDIVSRPGPRLVEGFEAYLKLLHPELTR